MHLFRAPQIKLYLAGAPIKKIGATVNRYRESTQTQTIRKSSFCAIIFNFFLGKEIGDFLGILGVFAGSSRFELQSRQKKFVRNSGNLSQVFVFVKWKKEFFSRGCNWIFGWRLASFSSWSGWELGAEKSLVFLEFPNNLFRWLR